MTIRFVAASVATLALIAGFALGRATGPGAVATAQVMSPLSHFMCYQTGFVTAGAGAAVVTDQFGSTERKFYKADMICAPAKKKPLDFKPLRVPGPADHLVCYHTEGQAINASRGTYNQLEKSQFKGLTPSYFCLPTYKTKG